MKTVISQMDAKTAINNLTTVTRQRNRSEAYREFDATELFCPKCKQPVPVRKRLLLVLPEGEKYEYLCAFCSESVGTKIERDKKPLSLIL